MHNRSIKLDDMMDRERKPGNNGITENYRKFKGNLDRIFSEISGESFIIHHCDLITYTSSIAHSIIHCALT